MSRTSRALLLSCTALSLGLLVTRPAAAQSTDKMAKDTAMMAHDSMGKDAMGKDAMGKDAMAMAPHGMIAGAEGHKAAGAFEITTANGKSQVKLDDAFSLEKGPDVYVLLSGSEKGGQSGTVNLGKLKKFSGAQSFDIPAATDLSGYTHLVFWCKKYNVTMGTASLASSADAMHK